MKKITIVVLTVLFIGSSLCASEGFTLEDGSLGLFFGGGTGGAIGGSEDGVENTGPDFTFNPGLRFVKYNLFRENSVLICDLGYWENGYVYEVTAADYIGWRRFAYVSLDLMYGKQIDSVYFAGGVYTGFATESWWISEIDGPVSVTAKQDFGLCGAAGYDVFPFLSLGVKAKVGIVSVRESTPTRNWALMATASLNLLRF